MPPKKKPEEIEMTSIESTQSSPSSSRASSTRNLIKKDSTSDPIAPLRIKTIEKRIKQKKEMEKQKRESMNVIKDKKPDDRTPVKKHTSGIKSSSRASSINTLPTINEEGSHRTPSYSSFSNPSTSSIRETEPSSISRSSSRQPLISRSSSNSSIPTFFDLPESTSGPKRSTFSTDPFESSYSRTPSRRPAVRSPSYPAIQSQPSLYEPPPRNIGKDISKGITSSLGSIFPATMAIQALDSLISPVMGAVGHGLEEYFTQDIRAKKMQAEYAQQTALQTAEHTHATALMKAETVEEKLRAENDWVIEKQRIAEQARLEQEKIVKMLQHEKDIIDKHATKEKEKHDYINVREDIIRKQDRDLEKELRDAQIAIDRKKRDELGEYRQFLTQQAQISPDRDTRVSLLGQLSNLYQVGGGYNHKTIYERLKPDYNTIQNKLDKELNEMFNKESFETTMNKYFRMHPTVKESEPRVDRYVPPRMRVDKRDFKGLNLL